MLLQEMLSDERKAARAEGLAEGRAEGLAKGRTEGEEATLRLVQLLTAQKRTDDIMKAINDHEYRKKLFEEFNL